MDVLFLGEVVGKPGITAVKALKDWRTQHNADFVICNPEGATGGFGIGRAHALQLKKLGCDILAGGEKIFFKIDMVDFIAHNPWILRPANYPMGVPGRGWHAESVGGRTVVVLNLLGTSSFEKVHLNNPFILANTLIDKIKAETENPVILVLFHAATTAEKQTMGYMLDGKVAAVIGTHTKVMSADACLLPGGTAYISDNGRCGSQMSVSGFANDVEIRKYTTAIPERSRENWTSLEMQGVLVHIGDDGKATGIETVAVPVETPPKPEV